METTQTQPYALTQRLSNGAAQLPALLPGLALSGAVAGLALWVARWQLPLLTLLGPLTLAMLLGLLFGQWLPARLRALMEPGLALARHRLLRIGIVFYGLRISLGDLAQVGSGALLVDIAVVLSVFTLAGWLGVKVLKLDPRTALLVGAGSAVCGAAAILATAPALRSRAEDIPVAIATVVLFGSAAMLLYPWLWSLPALQQLLGNDPVAFGRFVGSTVHEVAQVAAITGALDASAAHAAVITKLIRVMLLVPLIFGLGFWFARRDAKNGSDVVRTKAALPWFALIFLLMPFVTSSGVLDTAQLEQIAQADTALLAVAMAALGLDTHFAALRKGGRALLLGALLFLFLITAGLGLNLLAALL